MSNNNTQLPADQLEEIKLSAKAFADGVWPGTNTERDEQEKKRMESLYIKVAREYATKHHQLQKENDKLKDDFRKAIDEFKDATLKVIDAKEQVEKERDELKQWKIEAGELQVPIISYAHKHLEVKLGDSCTELVLDRCREYDQLKAKGENIALALRRLVRSVIVHPEYRDSGEWGDYVSGANDALHEWSGEKDAPDWVGWLTDDSPDVPDLSEFKEDEKKTLIETLFRSSGAQFMKMFYAIGLETFMETGIVNDATGDLFRLRFELLQKGNKEGKLTPEQITERKEAIDSYRNPAAKETAQTEPPQYYTDDDLRGIISMVCDQLNEGFNGREEFIEQTIAVFAGKKAEIDLLRKLGAKHPNPHLCDNPNNCTYPDCACLPF